MKANELRIGNIIYKGNELFEITKGFEIDSADCTVIPYSPIPLTEEWLIKFGFIQDNNGTYWKQTDGLLHYLDLIQSIDFYYPVLGQVAEVSSENEQRINLNFIQYVHELQNLWYTITGQELQTK